MQGGAAYRETNTNTCCVCFGQHKDDIDEETGCLVLSGFSVMMKSVLCGAIPSAWKNRQEEFYAPCVRTCFLEFQFIFYCCIFLILSII